MSEEFIEDIIKGSTEEQQEQQDKGQEEIKSSSTLEDSSKTDEKTSSKSDNFSEASTTEEQTNSGEVLTVEELASQLGWNANHQGENAVDAATYILRSKDIQKTMKDSNKELKSQVSALQNSVNAIKDHSQKVHQAEIKTLQKQINALKKERRAAVELADVEKVDELDGQIEGIQKDINDSQIEAVSKEPEIINPVYDEWIKDNEWYLQDDEMAQYADSVAAQYQGAPLSRIYSLVRNKVAEVFPERFEAPTKQEVVTNKETSKVNEKKPIGPPSPVEKSTNNKGSQNTFSKADLTNDQLNIMQQFVRSGIMTEEQYIKDIAKLQEA